MDKRGILAIVLSLVVLFIYQTFFVKHPSVPKQPESVQEEVAVEKLNSNRVAVERERKIQTKTIFSPQGALGEKDIPVDTPLYTATFTTKGGGLKSFKLKCYRKTINKNSELIELVEVRDAMPHPLTISFPDSSIDIPSEGIYEANVDSIKMTKTTDTRSLIFSQSYPYEIKVEKIFTFYPGRYTVDLEVRVYNLSTDPLNQNACLSWYQFVDPQAETDSYSHKGPISFVAKGVERQDVEKLDAAKLLGPDVSWGGFESKYFLAAMIPQNPSITSLSLSKDVRNMVSISLKGPKNLIPTGQVDSFNYSLYLGPKDYSILKAQGTGLENAIDFGSWLKWLAMPLLVTLKFLHDGYVHNYGIAIIILTVLIKIIFWPLGNKSYKSMKEMQKLQPKIIELREKYKNDKARLSQETMVMYKAHKVNPLGGCLPMVIQIPVFFGLYKALLYAIELRHSPFIWWIKDLSAKDPYYITPIIMGATMFLQQKMTPPAGDPMQAKIMLWMPVIFTFLFLNFPSGLVIYWLFNNIISIGQQYYINKRL
ncbi:MAG: membrane protein insertase YidC [Syntrophales bacterium]|nr:membrane protein insertase YidC [Syntrophales bacterium]